MGSRRGVYVLVGLRTGRGRTFRGRLWARQTGRIHLTTGESYQLRSLIHFCCPTTPRSMTCSNIECMWYFLAVTGGNDARDSLPILIHAALGFPHRLHDECTFATTTKLLAPPGLNPLLPLLLLPPPPPPPRCHPPIVDTSCPFAKSCLMDDDDDMSRAGPSLFFKPFAQTRIVLLTPLHFSLLGFELRRAGPTLQTRSAPGLVSFRSVVVS